MECQQNVSKIQVRDRVKATLQEVLLREGEDPTVQRITAEVCCL